MSGQDSQSNKMNVPVIPPFIFTIAMLIAFSINWFSPVHIVPDNVQLQLGFAVILIGLAPLPWIFFAFTRAKTTLHADHKASALITNGPYRFSRNPIYLSLISICLGIGICADNIWVLPALAAAIWYLFRTVIAVEEQYLEAHFGDEYRAYKQRVRRWI